jgi:hypothetical protein
VTPLWVMKVLQSQELLRILIEERSNTYNDFKEKLARSIMCNKFHLYVHQF